MTANRQQPYLSVVVAARNDNHGGDMLRRMQACLDSWITQAARYGLPSEIVVVEWNPPEGRPPLRQYLRWPAGDGSCPVRFVEVSRELHQAIPNAPAIPLHQMIAKNVGIRRAAGEFVLATNLDIIFSAELMRFLAERRLDPQALYRMDRWDIASEIPSPAGVDELLEFCGRNILRVSAREGTWDTSGDGLRPVEAPDIVAAGAGIRLGRGWFGVEAGDGAVKRSPGPDAEIACRAAGRGCTAW